MKTEHIVLRMNQGNTRDLFSGAASDLVTGYAGTSFPPAGDFFKAGGLRTAPQSVPEILGEAKAALAGRFMPEMSIELKEIERATISDIAKGSDVVAIAPNIPMSLIRDTGVIQPAALNQGLTTWGVQAVGADTSPFTGQDVVVAILDTGIDETHPAFAGIELVIKDFTGEGGGDPIGHGTHCAGTVFGRNNGVGRFGIAPGIKKALIGKVISQNGGASSATVIKAMEWAAENGANVISMSLGINFPDVVQKMIAEGVPTVLAASRALEAYVATIRLFEKTTSLIKEKGNWTSNPIVFVAAAGNDSDRKVNLEYELAVTPPANSEGFISVGALGIVDGAGGLDVANFSNTGPNISAPGVDVISAEPGGGLSTRSGTSMATPHVAGVAALWVEKMKTEGLLNSNLLTARILGSASTTGLLDGYDRYDVGAGLARAPQQ